MVKMSIDYEAEDSKLDDELRAAYAIEEQTAKDSPSEEGTEPEASNTEQEEPDEGTLIEEVKSEPETEPKPDVVEAERYKNAVKAMNAAQAELADRRKQDNEVNNYIKQLQEQNQSLLQSLKTKPEEAAIPQTIADDDVDLKEAKEIYPEVINPLLKIIANLEKKLANVSDDVGNVRGEVGNVKAVADRYQQSEQKNEADRHMDAIKMKHPDVDEIVTDPVYAEWYNGQDESIQRVLQEGNAKSVISALNMFRADHPKSVPELKQEVKTETAKPDKLAAAKEAASPTVKSSSNPTDKKQTFTQAQIDKMSREEFTKNEAAIDEAIARGEVY
jgi:hypothetical protein